VSRKRGKLKKNDSWHLEGQKLKVVRENIYLGVNLEITGDWRRQKQESKQFGIIHYELFVNA
jgi:hypothetical protein